jgi:hypothetical protein
MNLTLLEANVDNTSAVNEAIGSLLARDAQAIWVGGDNTVIAAIGAVIGTAQRAGVPVFTILPGAPDRGTLFDAGPDFYEVGRRGGFLIADVLDGQDIQRMPIRDVQDLVPPYLSVNTNALKGLKESWSVPADILADATVVVDENGIQRKSAAVDGKTTASSVAAARQLSRAWRIRLVELTQTLDVEDSEKGVLDGLRDAGLVVAKADEVVGR